MLLRRLKEAVDAFRAALQVRAREQMPLQWATTQNNLGLALMGLGEREHGTARLQEAVEAFEGALDVFQAAQAAYYVSAGRDHLELARDRLAQRQASLQRGWWQRLFGR